MRRLTINAHLAPLLALLACAVFISAFTSCREAKAPRKPAAEPVGRPSEEPAGPAIFPPGPPPGVEVPDESAPVATAPPVPPGPAPVKAATQPNPPRPPSRCFLVEVKPRGAPAVAEVPCPR